MSIIFYLWFVKDNSVCIPNSVNYLPQKPSLFLFQRNLYFTNCRGIFQTVEFSRAELQTALSYHNKFSSIRKIGKSSSSDLLSSNVLLSKGHFAVYNEKNRIERALYFLSSTRMQSYLPHKIALYIAVFECLFTTSNIEVTQKVSERVAFYIGGDAEKKQDNYRLLQTAYSLRSDFFHGQQLNKKYKSREQQTELTIKIDALLRATFSKIIINDFEIFLRPEKDLNDWFTELIFSS